MFNITLYADDAVQHLEREIGLVEKTLQRVLHGIVKGNLLDIPRELTIACIPGYDGGAGKWNGGIDPQTGIVYINPVQEPVDLFHTIIHELIHVEQMFIEALGFDPITQRSTWFGIGFNEPTNFLDYLALPWEMEAFRQEKILAENLRLIM